MAGCEMEWKGCGRIDPHPGHHWQGLTDFRFGYDAATNRWVAGKHTYWCKGEWIVEGGSPHGRPRTRDSL